MWSKLHFYKYRLNGLSRSIICKQQNTYCTEQKHKSCGGVSGRNIKETPPRFFPNSAWQGEICNTKTKASTPLAFVFGIVISLVGETRDRVSWQGREYCTADPTSIRRKTFLISPLKVRTSTARGSRVQRPRSPYSFSLYLSP